MRKSIVLASLLGLSLMAADADYQTQQDSADKAFNELEGKETTDKDLELQKKELEIERLKLELERKKLAEEKQNSQQPAPSYQEPARPAPTDNGSVFYIGFEVFNANGTREVTLKDSSGSTLSTAEADIDFSQQAFKLGLGGLGDNRLTLDFVSGRKLSNSDTGNDLYKEGTGIGLTWDIVMSSLYRPASPTNFLPFLRLGFSVGSYEYLDEQKYLYADDKATTVEFTYGLGMYFQINKTLELAASYDIQTAALAYEDSYGNKLEITDQVGGLAIGLNVHF